MACSSCKKKKATNNAPKITTKTIKSGKKKYIVKTNS